MSVARRLLLFALVLAAPMVAVAQGGALPACIEVHGSARWGASAYNHYVRISNGCDHPARCSVATDVNPEAQTVEVPAGESVEVLTFLGSPAREFTPRVSCSFVE
jgi:hypothetical protein